MDFKSYVHCLRGRDPVKASTAIRKAKIPRMSTPAFREPKKYFPFDFPIRPILCIKENYELRI